MAVAVALAFSGVKTLTNFISNVKVAFAGITGGLPLMPYANSEGILIFLFPLLAFLLRIHLNLKVYSFYYILFQLDNYTLLKCPC